jgi:hypothetical protein
MMTRGSAGTSFSGLLCSEQMRHSVVFFAVNKCDTYRPPLRALMSHVSGPCHRSEDPAPLHGHVARIAAQENLHGRGIPVALEDIEQGRMLRLVRLPPKE